MQTTAEAREHCRFGSKGIEKVVVDGGTSLKEGVNDV